MSCDTTILRGKIAQVARAILSKECLTEEIIDDLNACGTPFNQVWHAVRDSVKKLSCTKLKGRVIMIGKQRYLEVPIVKEIALMVSDFLTSVVDRMDPLEFMGEAKENGKLGVITPADILNGGRILIEHDSDNEINIVLEGIEHWEKNIILILDATDSASISTRIEVTIAEFEWL